MANNVPTTESDLTVTIHKQPMRILGWKDRHNAHPAIRNQIEKCNGVNFHALFRGVREIPFEPELFVLGLKARPMYATGDPDSLTSHARSLAMEEAAFDVLVEDFVASPMMTRKGKCSVAAVKKLFGEGDERHRVRLAQLLLYALHYQNTREEVARWRDHLFVLSATTSAEVALRYALGHKPKVT